MIREEQVEIQKVTNAVILMLKAGMGKEEVYDHNAPVNRTFPYWCVYRIPGGGFGGPPLTNPDQDVSLVFQIDAVGTRRDQAEWAADKSTAVMLSRTNGELDNVLPLPNTLSECGRMRSDVPGGVEQEGEIPNTVYTAVNRFTVVVTPSDS